MLNVPLDRTGASRRVVARQLGCRRYVARGMHVRGEIAGGREGQMKDGKG